MAICREREFLQYEAFLSERLGVVLLELGQFEKAEYYVSRAVSLFKGWSAPAKVYAVARSAKDANANESCRLQPHFNEKHYRVTKEDWRTHRAAHPTIPLKGVFEPFASRTTCYTIQNVNEE